MYKYIILVFSTFFFLSCNDDPVSPQGNSNSGSSSLTSISGDWSIPINEVLDGGPGKDGIPSLTEPNVITVAEAEFIRDFELVLGYVSGDEARAYPHKILDWHEIINDDLNGEKIAVTYCPLTGTGVGWSRIVNNRETTFGVSGLLYKSNLIPFDRLTDSNWSQILSESVNGSLNGDKALEYKLVETTWETWKEMYPESTVVSTETGFARNYQVYPYGDYRTNNDNLIFPVNPLDRRLPSKDRVLGVIYDNDVTKVYPLKRFGIENTLIIEEVENRKVLIVGNLQKNFAVAFDITNHTSQEFTVLNDQGSKILVDNTGTEYDIFGRALNSDTEDLSHIPSFIGFYFSWGAFYPRPEIYSGE